MLKMRLRVLGVVLVGLGGFVLLLVALSWFGLQIHRGADYWGTIPQWLTFLVALVVGGFSIWGIITARASYEQSVNDNHLAQARLVYAPRPSYRTVKKGDSMEKVPSGWNLAGGAAMNIKTTRAHGGGIIFVPVGDVICFTLAARNNSKEVIGNVTVDLLDQLTRQPLGEVSQFIGEVDPEYSESMTVCVPLDSADFNSTIPRVRFTDSAGVKWSRIGTEPVKAD